MNLNIIIENFDLEKLDELGITLWPIWQKEISCFSWNYDERETCYIIEGEAVIKSKNGDIISIKAGDKVVFPQGLVCSWDIKAPIRKYYNFG